MKSLETIEELEILFLTFNEIASLEYCNNLKKLTREFLHSSKFCRIIFNRNTVVLNNGIVRISNLSPVAMTLTSLCICDQVLLDVRLFKSSSPTWLCRKYQ